jgi:hypothetical protein
MLASRFLLFLAFAVLARAQQPHVPLAVDAGRVQGGIRFHTEAVLGPTVALGEDYAAYFETRGDRMPDRVVVPIVLGSPPAGPLADKAWPVFPDPKADPTNAASYVFRPVEAVLDVVTAHAPAIVRIDIASSADGSSGGIGEAAQRAAAHFVQRRAEGQAFGIEAWLVCGFEASGQEQRETASGATSSANANPADAAISGVVEALRGVEPRLPVGRCLAWPETPPAANGAGPRVSATRAPDFPPDFYGWVFPDAIGDANQPRRMAQQIRAWLNGSGGERIDLRVSSPTVGRSQTERNSGDAAEWAARLAVALIGLQDAPVATIALDLWSETRGAGEQNQQAVLRAAAQLAETPHRLATEGGGSGGYALLAGRSDDRTSLRILIANHPEPPASPDDAPRPPDSSSGSSNAAAQQQSTSQPGGASGQETAAGYDLAVKNLPWGAADFAVSCYRVDRANNLELIWEGGGRGGSLRLHRQLPAQAVELILMQQRDQPVSDRMPRRRERR